MTDLRDIWRELESESPPENGQSFRRLKEKSVCGTRLFVSIPSGLWGLSIEVAPSAMPPRMRFAGTSGYSAIVSSESWEGGRRAVLSLESAAKDLNEIFCQLAEDLVSLLASVDNQSAAIEAIAARLEAWTDFFRNHGQTGLSRERQQGIYAEMLVLRTILFPRLPTSVALASWLGPLRRPHDFITPNAALEVKSSIGPAGGSVVISNARQLDDGGAGVPLFLLVCHLEVAANVGETLSAMAEAIEALLSDQEPEQTQQFRSLLLAAGWTFGDRNRYDDRKYIHRGSSAFQVIPGFPRLTESSLPAGIEDATYRLALGACEPFRVSVEQILSAQPK
jgi:hypothetical protein